MTERRLPVKQLVILSICRFAEPIALTSVLPYLPEMVESFGVPRNDIARWAGLASATFSLSQGLTGIPWGIASDKFGRKPIILIGLVNTMVTTLMWGFSTSLPMAITARALQGLMNGNVGILRTTVAELCPWKELQPRAFSIMPLVYTVGAIVGPTLGGALSNPLGIDPRKPRGDKFFERFPYCLPNLVGSGFFMIGIVTGFLFLQETLSSKKNKPDYGLMLGNKITAWFRKTLSISRRQKKFENAEREPLLGPKTTDEETPQDLTANPLEPYKEVLRQGVPTMREVLTYQTTLNLVVYTLLAMYSLAYDQLLPVFMHHPPQSIDDPKVKLPFKFAGGFGIGSRRIGAIFTVFSVSTTLAQFLLFPPLAQRLGVLRCLRIAFLIFPFVFFVTPFISLLPTQTSKEIAMIILLMIRGIGGTFAFPTSTIMLTNSASSLRILGTLNGLATSVSALGRGAGPASGGTLFTIGVKHGYIILPFWALGLIALLAFIPTLWLVEGKGFGDDPDSDMESVDSDSDDGTKPTNNTISDAVDILSESEYGEPTGLLSYTSTRSSFAVASDGEDDMSDDMDPQGQRERRERRGTENSLSLVRSRSRSRRVRRRSSVPVGMGVGFRRLSSNLGSTGIGAGTSWGGT